MDRTLFSKQSQEEVCLVHNLIPKSELDVEKRKELNKKIREILPKISNDAIICLYGEHQLSFVELRRRFQNEMFNDLSELIRLFEMTLYSNIRGVFHMTWQQALKVSKTSSSLEIAELLRDFGADRVGDDYTLFEEILSQRDDLEEISKLVNSFNINLSELGKIIWFIEQSKEKTIS